MFFLPTNRFGAARITLWAHEEFNRSDHFNLENCSFTGALKPAAWFDCKVLNVNLILKICHMLHLSFLQALLDTWQEYFRICIKNRRRSPHRRFQQGIIPCSQLGSCEGERGRIWKKSVQELKEGVSSQSPEHFPLVWRGQTLVEHPCSPTHPTLHRGYKWGTMIDHIQSIREKRTWGRGCMREMKFAN